MADNVSYKYIHQSYSNKLKNKKKSNRYFLTSIHLIVKRNNRTIISFTQIYILLYYLFYVFFFCKFQR